jgi:hypothetical protein
MAPLTRKDVIQTIGDVDDVIVERAPGQANAAVLAPVSICGGRAQLYGTCAKF